MNLQDTGERGSGTINTIGIVAALFIMGIAIAGLIGVISAQQRATTAADLAALAAADSARGLIAGEPCTLAQEVAENNDATLIGCSPHPHRTATVDVRVTVAIKGPLHFLGSAEAKARAGPPPGQ